MTDGAKRSADCGRRRERVAAPATHCAHHRCATLLATPAGSVPQRPARARGDWRTIRTLLPYLGIQGPRAARRWLPGRGQARQRRRAAGAEADRRRRSTRRTAIARRAAGAARRLRRCCGCRRTLFTELRDIVFAQGDAARGAHASRSRCSATCTRCRCASTSSARPAA